MIKLSDDGTLDTVLVCDECNEHFRYTYDAESFAEISDDEEAHDAFVEWALEDAASDHDCDVNED